MLLHVFKEGFICDMPSELCDTACSEKKTRNLLVIAHPNFVLFVSYY